MGKFLLILLITFFKSTLNFKEWWEESIVFEFTNNNVDNYIGSDKYIIIEFYTKWCQYCKLLFPVYEEVFKKYNETRKDIIIGRINCEFNSKTCENFGVFAYPNIVLFIPNSKRMKSVFTQNREVNIISNWINDNCPVIIKKNLKGKNIEYNISTKNFTKNREKITEENEYFKRQFISIKDRLILIEEKMKKISSNKNKRRNNKVVKKIKKEEIKKIKINSTTFLFLIIGILLFNLFKQFSFSLLLNHTQIPDSLHQKN